MQDRPLHNPLEPLALTPDKAAETIGLQSPTLDKDRREGHLGIPFVKAGRRVIYQLSDLKAWLEEQKQTPMKKGS
jgi:hypothetical protein